MVMTTDWKFELIKSDRKNSEAKALFADLDKPSLVALSYVLRHPEMWPEGFVWDYSQCEQCAMGMAHKLWRSAVPEGSNEVNEGASVMARTFAISYTDALSIFFGRGDWCPVRKKSTGILWWKKKRLSRDFDKVTPDMVADAIDAYLKKAR